MNQFNTKLNLNFYYQMVKDALEARDVNQAIKISKNGLKQAHLENNENWIQKFNLFKGSLNISQKNITYNYYNQNLKARDSKSNDIINSYYSSLHNCFNQIFSDIVNEGIMFNFFKKFLKIEVEIQKTFMNKKIYFEFRNDQSNFLYN